MCALSSITNLTERLRNRKLKLNYCRIITNFITVFARNTLKMEWLQVKPMDSNNACKIIRNIRVADIPQTAAMQLSLMAMIIFKYYRFFSDNFPLFKRACNSFLCLDQLPSPPCTFTIIKYNCKLLCWMIRFIYKC